MIQKYSHVKVAYMFKGYVTILILMLMAILVKQVTPGSDCSRALGMEDKNITDSQITTSSQYRTSCVGHNARLNFTDEQCAAWCPNKTNAVPGDMLTYTEYIQIDFRKPTKVTKVATQGMYNNTAYHVKKYRISYSFDNMEWKYIRNNGLAKIFTGNTDKKIVASNTFVIPIVAKHIRIHAGQHKENIVCLRLELYGCPWKDTGQVRSYSIPKGNRTPNQKLSYTDTDYNGKLENNIYTDGVGLLTDGKPGPVDSKENGGRGWIGWLSTGIHPHGVNITFEFYSVRKFTKVTLTMNVNKGRQNFVFEKSRVFFANRNDAFCDDIFLEYCPKQDGNETKNVNVSLSLCGSTGKFVKIQLFPRSKWTLVSEVKFISEPANKTEARSVRCKASSMRNVPSTKPSSFHTTIFTNNTQSSDQEGGCVVWSTEVYMIMIASASGGWAFGMVFLYVIQMVCGWSKKRGKEKSSNDASSLHDYEIPENDTTFQKLGLGTLGSEVRYSRRREGANKESQTGYAELNKSHKPEDNHEYQSLNFV